MNITGRKAEWKELERCERSGKSELICVYGRRRVGKTYLIEQFFSGCMTFRATGVENANTRQQLKAFHMRLQEHGDKSRNIPRDWFEAFSRLDQILSESTLPRSLHGKKVVFLDEFPWFATPRSDFLMAFGEYWNRCGSANRDYLFIICGSATSWMIGNIIENTGSLYNRVTSRIFLSPFTLWECGQYFSDRDFGWSRKQIAEFYMIFGGLPYYMELLDRNESLRQNADRLLFAPHAMLRNESSRLLEATLKKSAIYAEILKYLSAFRHGAEKQACFEQLGFSKGSFARATEDLLKCGYIREYKNEKMGRNPLFLQLVDPFLLFHYAFLSEQKKTEVSGWGEFMDREGLYSNWRGMAFEILCLQHTEQIKRALGISGVRTRLFPWMSKKKQGGAQIDLVIERDDGITNLCEMKFTDKPFSMTAKYEAELLNKAEVFRDETKTKHAIRLVLISASGLAGVAHTEHLAQTLTLEDLFTP